MAKSITSEVLYLEGWLSYPNIFKAVNLDKGDATKEPKFSANLIMDKQDDARQIQQVRDVAKRILAEYFGGADKVPKGIKLCLKDGLEKEDVDGYGGDVMFISASHKKRPVIVDRQAVPVITDDGRFYAGCRVIMSVTLWVQDNTYGKKVNANLLGVQFVRDDEQYGEGSAKPEFKALPDADVLN